MAMFFHEDKYSNQSPTGFDKYRKILERDYKNFFLAGFITILAFIPFAIGMFFSFACKSLLIMLLSSIFFGLFSGPALYGMYDIIFRSLRDLKIDWFYDYKKAIKNNWKESILSGIILNLFIGAFAFIFMLFWWTGVKPSAGTIFILCLSLIIVFMLLSVYFPQLVLFKQTNSIRFKNCILFCIKYFWSTLRTALLKICYLFIIFLFMPWSIFLILTIGIWFILFLSNFLLYDNLKQAFNIKS